MDIPSTLAALVLLIQAGSAEPSEKVRVTSPSGAVLAGTFVDAGSRSPGVLFFHMCRPDAVAGWMAVAERLRESGVSSLMLAYPGYGESTRQTAGTGDQRTMDAEAAFDYLRTRVGDNAAIATAGSSCGVNFALQTALRHPGVIRAVVALTGPHTQAHVEFVRKTSTLAVFTGSAQEDRPAPDWAQALKDASSNAASRLRIAKGKAHGTDIFIEQPEVAAEIAEWLAGVMKAAAKQSRVPKRM